MKLFRKVSCCRVVLALSILGAGVSASGAADYPAKTVQIVNPFPPGAVTDIIARLVNDKISAALGQPVVVVNKTGGGGAVGIKSVKDAPADGYTILIAPPPIVLIPLARKNIGFEIGDFTPLNLIGRTPAVMIVKADSPWKTMEDFIGEAKRKPGQLTFGTPGSGTSGHFAMELFKKETGINLIHVPLGGEAPVATGVMGGNIHTSIIGLGTVRPHIEAGALRALVTATQKRVKELPTVPTTFEKGLPAVEASPWFVFFVRASTPPAIVDKLGKAISDALSDKEIIAKIEKAGVSVENIAPEETKKYLASEHKRWSEVAKIAKLD